MIGPFPAQEVDCFRIAMWSGPRNISTTLLRSFESRPDTHVCDEPLYAHYLVSTGLNHPGRDEIIARHECDWRVVVDQLTAGRPPGGVPINYQKHMAHHLLPHIDRAWLGRLTNCFLIRNPEEMLLSLLKHYPSAGVNDTGLPQQVELFWQLQNSTGQLPLVIDARDVLESPRMMLTALCSRIGIPFDDAMLRWEMGFRDTDGIWAKHWYDKVVKSTGFAPYTPSRGSLPAGYRGILNECVDCYVQLYAHRLKAVAA